MKRVFHGIMKEDLRSFGAYELGMEPEHQKGDLVKVEKKRVYDQNMLPTKKFEYHYTTPEGKNLVRSSKFLIEEK